jgi:hypothetical protein
MSEVVYLRIDLDARSRGSFILEEEEIANTLRHAETRALVEELIARGAEACRASHLCP